MDAAGIALDMMAPLPPFRVLTLEDCATSPPRGYIIKGLLAPGDVAVKFGPPGSGKSVSSPYLAHAIAAGRSVFGRRVRRGAVLYVACEDGAGMRQRCTALRRVYGPAPGFRLVAEPIDLMTPDAPENPLAPAADHDPTPAHAKALRDLAEQLGAVLVVIDTLAAAFPGLQENEAAAMDHVVRVARYIAASGAAVLLVHHGAKNEGTTPRGHGRLDGDADLTMRIATTEGSGQRTVTMGKNRNGPVAGSLAFTIRAEVLGTDEDGDAITAPIAVEVEEGPSSMARKAPKLPEAAALLLREMTSLAAEGAGEMTKPEPGMPMVHVIPRKVLRSRLVRSGWFAPDEVSDLLPGAEKLSRGGYRAENKALNTLKIKGCAGFNQHVVWLA
jgi:KaiC/GvpD/RAD55 family RecA-like ATPase